MVWDYRNQDSINSNLIWLWGWEFEPTISVKNSSDIVSGNMEDHSFLCFGIVQMDTPGTTPTIPVTSTSFLYLVGLSLQVGKPIKVIHGYKYVKNYNGSIQSFVSDITKLRDLSKYEVRTDSYTVVQDTPFSKRIKILMGALNGDGTTSIKVSYDNVLYVYRDIPCFSSTLTHPATVPFIKMMGGGNVESNYTLCSSLSNLLLTGYTCSYEVIPSDPPIDPSATFVVSLEVTNGNSYRNDSVTVNGVITPINSYTGTLNVSLVGAPTGITLVSDPITVTDPFSSVDFSFTLNISSIVSINRYPLSIVVSDGNIIRTVIFTLTVLTTGIQIPDLAYASINNYNVGIHSHTLTTLNNNKVLLIGGFVSPGNSLDTCYVGIISEGSTNTTISWIPSTPYEEAIYGHSTVRLFDGRILVIGGQSSTGITNNCYIGIFNNVSNTITWMRTTDYPLPIDRHSAVLLSDGRILVVGGWTGTVLNRSCYFGTVNNNNTITWLRTTDYPFTINKHVMLALENNKVLVVGGNDGINIHSECYIGTIENNSIIWLRTTDYPYKVRDHMGLYINNNYIAIIGGFDGKSYKRNCYIGNLFNLFNITWFNATDFPSTIGLSSITPLTNNKSLIVGGWNGNYLSNTYMVYV